MFKYTFLSGDIKIKEKLPKHQNVLKANLLIQMGLQ